jgi:hypothetical protein
MTQYINNNRALYDIHDALKKIRELNLNIVEYDNFIRIIQSELYYLLKHHKSNEQFPNVTRDLLLCEFIDKCEGFYIQAKQVKEIVNFMKNSIDNTLHYSWFMKNVKNGYVPTSAIIYEVIDNLTIEDIDKLLENKPLKFNKLKIFTNNFLIKNVFNTTVESAIKIFKKYNITNEEINNLITNTAFSNHSLLRKIEQDHFCTYVTNILKYKKLNNQKLTFEEFTMLLNTQFYQILNFKFKDRSTNPDSMEFVTTFKQISQKITDDQLINIIYTGIQNFKNLSELYIEFVTTCCNFDMIDKSNIHKFIMKIPYYKFPERLFEKFYKNVKDIDFITTLIVNNQSAAILELLETPEKLSCSNEEIFKVAFEYASISLIKYFLNNKFTITEDMVLKSCNSIDGIFLILEEAKKHGFYVTEKCFDQLLFNMYIYHTFFDSKKIQGISIYVNDDEDFKKFIPSLESKFNEYKNLETNILTKLPTTIEYLKDKKVTNEMIILCNSKKIRSYLIDKMNKEKQIKKIIVKKVIKKVS